MSLNPLKPCSSFQTSFCFCFFFPSGARKVNINKSPPHLEKGRFSPAVSCFPLLGKKRFCNWNQSEEILQSSLHIYLLFCRSNYKRYYDAGRNGCDKNQRPIHAFFFFCSIIGWSWFYYHMNPSYPTIRFTWVGKLTRGKKGLTTLD